MYRVRRDQTKVEVLRCGEVIYSGTGDEYLVFKDSEDAKTLTVKRIRELDDAELLAALAVAIRIEPVRNDFNESK